MWLSLLLRLYFVLTQVAVELVLRSGHREWCIHRQMPVCLRFSVCVSSHRSVCVVLFHRWLTISQFLDCTMAAASGPISWGEGGNESVCVCVFAFCTSLLMLAVGVQSIGFCHCWLHPHNSFHSLVLQLWRKRQRDCRAPASLHCAS